MIVVDSSVWIAHLRNQPISAVATLRSPDLVEEILVGDLVLTEVLQGARNEAHATRLETALRQFPLVAMVGDAVAARAARNYRQLRSAGVTMNKLADLLIATFCVEHGHHLLHCDADFKPMERFCGLRCVS